MKKYFVLAAAFIFSCTSKIESSDDILEKYLASNNSSSSVGVNPPPLSSSSSVGGNPPPLGSSSSVGGNPPYVKSSSSFGSLPTPR